MKNDGIADSVFNMSGSQSITVDRTNRDMVLAVESFRRIKGKKLKQQNKSEQVREAVTTNSVNSPNLRTEQRTKEVLASSSLNSSSTRTENVESPVQKGYVPDFAEDDDADDLNESAVFNEMVVPSQTETRDNSVCNGRTSVMSNSSDRWSTCSTGADSVVLLAEPSSDEKRYGSISTLPDTVMQKQSEKLDEKQAEMSDDSNSCVSPARSKEEMVNGSKTDVGIGQGMISSSQEDNLDQEESQTVNVKG